MSKAKNIVKLASSLPDSAVVPISSGGTGANTAQAALLALGAGGATLKISSIAVTNSSYSVLDDTAVDIAGGYIKITGTGFASGCQVIVNQTPATSTSYVSATEVRAQLPATTAGTYTVYVVNTDGAVAIRVNGVTFSALPAWTTGSTLPDAGSDVAISIQLAATLATTYTVASGSTLPTGLTLSSTGLLSGAVAGTIETTYNFTITATDAEAQDSPRAFSINITVGEPYFRNTVLLLTGDGVNAGTNNTFLDSSSNNFAVTRVGTPAQGSISPFSPTGWSGYFNGTGDYLSVADNAALNFGSGDFTIEIWVFVQNTVGTGIVEKRPNANGVPWIWYLTATTLYPEFFEGTSRTGNIAVLVNQWTHLAVTRSSGTMRQFVNGVQAYSGTVNTSLDTTGNALLMRSFESAQYLGNASNLRIVKGTAVYTANFTPSITPLTAIANTSLLTLQDNRFKDNSTNAFAITASGTPSIQALSPFAPANAYNTSAHGGSMYFNGTTDYLSLPSSATFAFGTGDFTIEAWINRSSGSGNQPIAQSDALGLSNNDKWWFAVAGGGLFFGTHSGGGFNIVTTTTFNTGIWHHVAVTRASGVMAMFINGVSTAFTTTGTPSGHSLSQNGLTIAAMSTPSYWNGYVSNFRIVKGTAVYTANFTPPTAPVTAITNTSLLLNGTNAAIYDATGKNDLITVGDAKISTAVKKFGTGSISFDGTGDYLSIPATSINRINTTGNFTIEFWAYFNTVAADQRLIGWDNNTNNFVIAIYTSSAGVLSYYLSSTGTTWSVAQQVLMGSINSGAWYHVALVRNGSVFTPYINGVAGTTTTSSAVLTNSTLPFTIGSGGGTSTFNGYIDDLRITKNVARYTANFTPPIAAHILK